jgi:ribulose kinase
MLLAHDLGTTGSKASRHDDDGALLASVTVAHNTVHGHGGVAKQNPPDWIDGVCRAEKAPSEHRGIDACCIEAVNISPTSRILRDSRLRTAGSIAGSTTRVRANDHAARTVNPKEATQ